MKKSMTLQIAAGVILGVVIGYLCHTSAPDKATASTIAGYFSIASDVFLRLIKMIVAPLVFGTIVSGLAGMHGGGGIARIGLRTVGWFMCASLMSLALGLVLADVFKPGAGLHMVPVDGDVQTGLKTSALNLNDFITHLFPSNFIDAMAHNEILQILVFSLFCGVALNSLKNDAHARVVIDAIDGIVAAMLRITEYVMRLAPLGVLSAIASTVTVKGLDILTVYGKLIGEFYFGIGLLWALLISAGFIVLGSRVFSLVKAVREPAMIAFATASSEAAYPRLAEQLQKFGIDKRVVGLVLPLGYSFNLDGSMMYQAFASLFIAQAFGVNMPLSQQILMLLVLLVSSKGMAGVPRGSVVVVAAIAPFFHLPASGVLLVLAIDQILDMGRTATNVIGNSIATAAVAKWEGHRVAIGQSSMSPTDSVRYGESV